MVPLRVDADTDPALTLVVTFSDPSVPIDVIFGWLVVRIAPYKSLAFTVVTANAFMIVRLLKVPIDVMLG
jgi:hypothetical protein